MSRRERILLIAVYTFLAGLMMACHLHEVIVASTLQTAHPVPSGDLVNGELKLLLDKATASIDGFQPGHGCWPSSYYDDGGGFLTLTESTFEGHCAWTSPSEVNPDVKWDNVGTLKGVYNYYDDEVNVVLIQFTTTLTYPDLAVIVTTIDGAGEFTTETHAEGRANYTSQCTSLGEADQCGGLPNAPASLYPEWRVTGEVPWTMDFERK